VEIGENILKTCDTDVGAFIPQLLNHYGALVSSVVSSYVYYEAFKEIGPLSFLPLGIANLASGVHEFSFNRKLKRSRLENLS